MGTHRHCAKVTPPLPPSVERPGTHGVLRQKTPACLLMEKSCRIIFFFFFPLNLFIYFIYLFLAVLGLCCCTRAFSSCGELGLLFVAVHGLLTGMASLVAEHGL